MGWGSTDDKGFLLLSQVSGIMVGIQWFAMFFSIGYFCNKRSMFWRRFYAYYMLLMAIMNLTDIGFIFGIATVGISPIGHGFYIIAVIIDILAAGLYLWWFWDINKYANAAT